VQGQEDLINPSHELLIHAYPRYNKYELDSLCGFLKLSRSYYQATKDTSFMNDNCEWNFLPSFLQFIIRYLYSSGRRASGHSAIEQIFRVIIEQSQPTFDEEFNFISFYNWTGGNHALSPMVNNHGNGEPKAYTGMVGTHHRPSDDLSVYGKADVILYPSL
jgi:uncharacterized protein